MTALKQFQRLEATALYTPPDGGQRRDVFLSLGEATLTITDHREQVVSHWSLAALNRLPAKGPAAIYSPDPDGPEQIELSDDTFIRGIEKVRAAIGRGRGRPGFLRGRILKAGLVVIVALAVVWLPPALTRTAAAVMQGAARDALDRDLIAVMSAVTGPACDLPQGQAALDRLSARLWPDRPPEILVLGPPMTGAARLPGGTVILGHSALTQTTDPADPPRLLASLPDTDPLLSLLNSAGFAATIRLILTGHLAEDITRKWGRQLVTETRAAPPAADAAPLSDDSFLALQAICDPA